MLRTPGTWNFFAYRAHSRALLFVLITVITGWLGFTSHSARLADPNPKANATRGDSTVPATQLKGDTQAGINKSYGNLPLSFEANRGQTSDNVNFIARGPGYNIFLTPGEAVFTFQGQAQTSKRSTIPRDAAEPNPEPGANLRRRGPSDESGELQNVSETKSTLVRLSLEGANPNPREIQGLDELPGKVNYFLGNDSSKWLTSIPTYGKVAYRGIYPGIDVVYYGNGRELEYDLVIAAGADPNVIGMRYEGVNDLKIGRDGNLTLKTDAGDIRLRSPICYQEVNGARKPIAGRYVIRAGNSVGFRVANYDRSKPLVIDPILTYSSLLNTDGNGYAIAVDANGFAYITGSTFDSILNSTAGAYQLTFGGSLDAFVTKLNQSGTGVVYTTYLGGDGEEEAYGIALDAAGNAYLTGYASGTFPTTPGAFQRVLGSAFDCFITKLNTTGSALVYSTFYGGDDYDEGVSITVDAGGNAYVAGDSRSSNLVTTLGAPQPTKGDGADAFALRLNANGSALSYATHLGGGAFDTGIGIAVDSANNAYVVGQTGSLNFPLVNALQSAMGVDRGLFRSTNNGSSWILSQNGLTSSFVYSIVIDRNTPTTMYAGTSGGVSKSTDGGLTWFGTAPTNGTVRALAIDPTNSSILYAGTASGVYKTTNGGTSWTAMNNGLVISFGTGSAAFPIAIRTIAIDPSNPTTVYAGSASGLFRSTNGGATWIRVTGGGLPSSNIWAIVIDPVTPSTIYLGLNTAGVAKSTNSGVNWTAVNTGISNLSVRSLAIAPNAPATLFVGTLGGIFKTNNSGTAWSAVNNGLLLPFTDGVSRIPATINAIAVDPLNQSVVYAAATTSFFSNGVYGLTAMLRSLDGGISWTAVTSGFGSLNNGFQSVAIHPTNPALVFAGNIGDADGFAAKINPNGTSLMYSTYIASNRSDFAVDVVADAAGNSYVCGVISGTNFPVTPGAFRTSLSGSSDTFVMKLNAAGTSRIYSTYLGGGDNEDSYGIAVDSAGNAYTTGTTNSLDFPTTAGAFQRTLGNASNFNDDAFVTKLNPTGTAAVYSSYLGGAGNELSGFFDFQGNNIAVDTLGNAYVVGSTTDRNTFPVLGYANAFSGAGPSQTFVAKIDGNVASYSIRGQVTSPSVSIVGLVVEARNAQGLTYYGITDGQGFYSIVNLPAGDYTVTPQKFGPLGHYLYTPPSRTFNALSADQTANFTATEIYDIQGRVTSANQAGLGIFDVTITLSGAAAATTITDANGRFVLRDLLPGDYTVTPSKTGFTFDPVNISYPNLSANQTNANFTTASATFFSVGGHVSDVTFPNLNGAIISMVTTSQSGNRTQTFVTDGSGNYLFENLQAGGNYTFSATHFFRSLTPASQTFNNLSGNQTLDFTGSSAVTDETIKTWTFQGRTSVYVRITTPHAGFIVNDWGAVVRTGNDFSADTDANFTLGPSVRAQTTTVNIYDLGVVADGNYTFTLKNDGFVVKSQAFTVSSAPAPPNPIDNAREFVRQQYRDFLNREADPAGEDFWTDNITKCSDPARRPAGQTEAECTLRQRETTSGAFFVSPEFQYTGYFVHRMYKGALGRPPKLAEFTPDAQFVGNGIIVGGQLSGTKINQNKADYAAQFVNCTDPAKYRCSEFKAIYDGLTNLQYVNRLFQTTGINASDTERAVLVNGLNGGAETRASVLQKVVDGINVISEGNQQFTTAYGQAFYNSEFNRAFVQLEYFGYMRRDPDAAGFAFWLDKLNLFGGDFVRAEMVLAFISSPEYRARFGAP